jgi:beta-lactamase class A
MTTVSTTFQARVEAITGDVEGVIGLKARDLTTGRELAYNADLVFPTASTFKVPVLYALYRLSEAGAIDLTARVPIDPSHRVPGSGVLQDLDVGIAPTVRDLAVLMTVVSDNEATDLVYALVGKERLAAIVAELGLRQTSIPLTCREIFCTYTNLPADDPATTYDALKAALKERRVDPNGIALADDARNDTSTPADMVELMTLIEHGHGLSTEGRESVVDILKRQKYNTIIPLRLPEETEVAHKTGSLKGIRNDVGIVYAPSGPYTIALMSKRMTNEVDGALRLADLSRLVWDELTH